MLLSTFLARPPLPTLVAAPFASTARTGCAYSRLIETFKFRIGKSQHRVEKEITAEMANSDKSVGQSRFDFDIGRTGVRPEEHLATRRQIFEKPEPRMNKGRQIWVAAIVDEYLERRQLLRERLAARKDRIRELK
jgi:hypothetical protein